MKEIKLTQGKVTIVDDEDYERLYKYKWHYDTNGYAARSYHIGNNKYRLWKIHWSITSKPENKMEVDHINGNRLDNRKCNLRIVTRQQNQMNKKKPKNNKSGHKGVHYDKSRGKWVTYISVNYKRVHLGRFYNKMDAVKAYNKAANKFHGEFARLNRTGGGEE